MNHAPKNPGRRLLLFAALLAAAIAGCGSGQKEAAPAPPAVSAPVETVQRAEIPVTLEAAGTIRSKLTSVIGSKIPGQILSLPVREGDRVKAGQLLAEIDAREAAAGLARAKAALEEAGGALEEADRAIQAAEATTAAADAAAELSASTLKRYKALLEAGAVNRQEFEEVETKNKMALADAERAAQTLAVTRTRRPQVLARIEGAKAEVAAAQVALGYAAVKAPFDGLVIARGAEAGDMAMPGTPLVTVEDDHNYRLEAEAGESLAGSVKPGQTIPVRIDSLGGRELSGRVVEVVPAVSAGSRSFLVRLDLPATEGLRSGLFGRAFFPAGRRDALTVPDGAVIERGQLTGVFVVDASGCARWRLVKTGARQSGRQEILAGLSGGEAVVVGNLEKVADGVRIGR